MAELVYEPSAATTLWGKGSPFVHVTVVPAGTERSAGANVKSAITTLEGPVASAAVSASPDHTAPNPTMTVTTARAANADGRSRKDWSDRATAGRNVAATSTMAANSAPMTICACGDGCNPSPWNPSKGFPLWMYQSAPSDAAGTTMPARRTNHSRRTATSAASAAETTALRRMARPNAGAEPAAR